MAGTQEIWVGPDVGGAGLPAQRLAPRLELTRPVSGGVAPRDAPAFPSVRKW